MDRKLARKNLFTGLVAAALAVMIFGADLPVAAALYLRLMALIAATAPATAIARSRSICPATRLLPMFTALGITLALLGPDPVRPDRRRRAA